MKLKTVPTKNGPCVKDFQYLMRNTANSLEAISVFLSAVWLPRGQFGPLSRGQPHQLYVNHCIDLNTRRSSRAS